MGRRVELLRTLSGFASQTTLNGILTILDTCTGTAAGKKLGGSTTREWVERLIVNQPNSAKRNAWRKVLEVYPKENLSRDNKQLIKSALRKHDR